MLSAVLLKKPTVWLFATVMKNLESEGRTAKDLMALFHVIMLKHLKLHCLL